LPPEISEFSTASVPNGWRDTPARAALVDFVGRVCDPGPGQVPPNERIAVFDNDGTLWTEKPTYIQLAFIIHSMAAAARADLSLEEQAPFKAAVDGDLNWFDSAVEQHHQGDDSRLKEFGAAALSIARAEATDDFARRSSEFFASTRHPTLGRPYTACGYVPMVGLLRYLEAHDFTCYIVSGGGRDFVRMVSGSMYGIPPERVIGSSLGMEYRDGRVVTTGRLDVFDDGPAKPAQIWSHIGRRPIFAAGNSDGDLAMLEYTTNGSLPSLAMLVGHDDAERENVYSTGAENALRRAKSDGWLVASMKDDWGTVFGD